MVISPSELVVELNHPARLTCLYTPRPDAPIDWGVGKSGSFQFILRDNTANNIRVSNDTRSLIFDPVSRGQEGDYYCYVALSGNSAEDLRSSFVTLTILSEL